MIADPGTRIEIGDVVAGRSTFTVILLCGLTILAEGYDVGVMGAVLLALKNDPQWRLTPVEMGWLSSAALVGMLLGADSDDRAHVFRSDAAQRSDLIARSWST
jgi:hypothetical protein